MYAEANRTAVFVIFGIILVSFLMYGILLCVDYIHPPSEQQAQQRDTLQWMATTSSATSSQSTTKDKSAMLRLTMKERLAVVQEFFASSVCVYQPSSKDGRRSSSGGQEQDKSDVIGATMKEDADLEEGGELPETNEPICSICLLPYENGDRVLTGTNCTHMFHHDCLVQWLAKGNCDCPICRREIMSAKDMHDAVVQALG